MSYAKKVLVAIPTPLLELADQRAEHESRTRSELIREALRRYLGVCETPPLAMTLVPAGTTPETRTPVAAGIQGRPGVYSQLEE